MSILVRNKLLCMGSGEALCKYESFRDAEEGGLGDHGPKVLRKANAFRDTVVKIEAGFESSWLVTDRGAVYSSGNPGVPLGREVAGTDEDSALRFEQVNEFDGAPAGNSVVEICKVAASGDGSFVLLLDSGGSAYFDGSIRSDSGDHYRPGDHDDDDGVAGITKVPSRIPLGGPARDIYEGGNFVAVLMMTGDIKTFGVNTRGQLGRPTAADDMKESMKPGLIHRLPFRGQIRSLATGDQHMIVLTDLGEVWSCGSNTYGQLGYGGIDNGPHPELAKVSCLGSMVQVREVAAGCRFSLVLTHDGSVRSCGDSTNGSLGLGEDLQPDPMPIFVPVPFGEKGAKGWIGMDQVKMAAIGAKDLCAWSITESGVVWTWGFNDSMQLGHRNKGDVVFRPLPLALSNGGRALEFSCSGQHSLLLEAVHEVPAEQTVTIAPVATRKSTRRSPGRSKCPPPPRRSLRLRQPRRSLRVRAKSESISLEIRK